jgi:CubicO group peptidase (beta-lactamase class C family)
MKRSWLKPAAFVMAVYAGWTQAGWAQAQGSPPSAAAGANVLTPDTVILTVPLAPGDAPLQVTLKQAMQSLNDPGFSVAVIDDYKVAWARGYGVTAPGGNTPVTTRTLYQAASISKPVTAAGALWLVEQGKLQLDEDVNKNSRRGRCRRTHLRQRRK